MVDMDKGSALVLCLDHVLLDALHESLAAASGADAARAALNAQVLEEQTLQDIIKSDGVHDCPVREQSQIILPDFWKIVNERSPLICCFLTAHTHVSDCASILQYKDELQVPEACATSPKSSTNDH